jgi:tetratricopeptide (TPR) repeat protein
MTNFAKLNNIGISFLNRGNLDEAFNYFSLAMDLMKQTKESKEMRENRRRSVCEPIAALEMKSKQVVRDFCDQNMGCDSSTVCFVSKMTIMLPECHHTANDYWESSVLLFHLALTLHMLGIRRGMEGFLQRALKLYGLARTLMTQYLEDEEVSEQDRISGVGIQLVTSMLNNMGHIHYELKEYDASRRYF